MGNNIHRSKYINETVSIVLDFADLLEDGEGISGVSVSVAVFTGIDDNPANILYGVPSISGTKVDQKVRLGLSGVIYTITYNVVGTIASEVEKEVMLAILPQEDIAIPSFTTVRFSTTLYPYEYQDTLSSAISLQSIRELGYLEGIISNPSLTAINVFGSQITYNNYVVEGLTSTSALQSINIYGGQVNYTIPVESMTANSAVIQINIFGSQVGYNIPTENLVSNTSLSGITIT